MTPETPNGDYHSYVYFQERLLSRLELDRQVCASYLVSVCVRLFLERRELELARFVNEFRDASAADEKTALMERLLSNFWYT